MRHTITAVQFSTNICNGIYQETSSRYQEVNIAQKETGVIEIYLFCATIRKKTNTEHFPLCLDSGKFSSNKRTIKKSLKLEYKQMALS